MTIERAWKQLALKLAAMEIPDADVDTMKFVFIAGASIYRELLFAAVDAPEGAGDETGPIQVLDEELDQLITELETERLYDLAAEMDRAAIQKTAVGEGRPLSTKNKTRCRGTGRKKES